MAKDQWKLAIVQHSGKTNVKFTYVDWRKLSQATLADIFTHSNFDTKSKEALLKVVKGK